MDLNQIKKIQTKLRQITIVKIEELLKKEILANQKEIVAKVRNRWKTGKRPSGDIIGTYSSFAYEQEKRLKNPIAGGKVDLIDEGDLERGLVVNAIAGSIFTIFSTDEKAIDIASKYGLDVYGLTLAETKEVLSLAVGRVYVKLFKFVEL